MKIAVSGERLGRALPSKQSNSINYFCSVSGKLSCGLCNLKRAIITIIAQLLAITS